MSDAVMKAGVSPSPFSYRSDPNVPSFPDDKPVIIFDGHCGMCSAGARMTLRHDRNGKYRLLAAQSPLGQALYTHYRLEPVNQETVILLKDGVPWFKSEALIRGAMGLGFPWSMMAAWRVLPRAWRDALYDVVARNRFRIMGRRDACYAPEPQYRDRFIG